MNKEDLLKYLKEECASKEIKISRSALSKIYNMFMKAIKNELQYGQIRLHGVGTFYTAVSQEKKCRNPQNGETMIVPKRTRVKFKTSQTLLNILNEKKEIAN